MASSQMPGYPHHDIPPTPPYPRSDRRGASGQWWGGDRDGDRRGHRVRVGEEDREGTGTRTRTGG